MDSQKYEDMEHAKLLATIATKQDMMYSQLIKMNGTVADSCRRLDNMETTIYGHRGDKGIVGLVSLINSRQIKIIVIVATLCAGSGWSITEIVKSII